MDESQDDNAAERRHDKPLLTVEQQIAHMKAKGITFELCTEEDAAQHLRTKCQLFRVYAYRKLFPKHVGGLRDGQYANLDFDHMKELSNLDRKLRDVLLPMTLDVEHFAKLRCRAGGLGPFRPQEPALRPVRRGGGQLPPHPESGNRSPALLAALDKGRRAARLSSRYKAFGLIGAGLRNRFRPVFIPDGWGRGRFASFSRVSGYQLTRGVIVCVPLRTPCS